MSDKQVTEAVTSDGQRVEVGQVWADNDWRSRGRTVRVVAIGPKHVYVETVTGIGGDPAPKRKPTRILLNRLRPNSTGYRLVTSAS